MEYLVVAFAALSGFALVQMAVKYSIVKKLDEARDAELDAELAEVKRLLS